MLLLITITPVFFLLSSFAGFFLYFEPCSFISFLLENFRCCSSMLYHCTVRGPNFMCKYGTGREIIAKNVNSITMYFSSHSNCMWRGVLGSNNVTSD